MIMQLAMPASSSSSSVACVICLVKVCRFASLLEAFARLLQPCFDVYFESPLFSNYDDTIPLEGIYCIFPSLFSIAQ